MTAKITLKTNDEFEVERLHLLIKDHYFLIKENVKNTGKGNKTYLKVYQRDN